MYQLEKEFRFEASHQLMDHDGACARLHGHSWIGRVYIQGRDLQTTGPQHNMLLDYHAISARLKPLVARLDHHHLNDVLPSDMPTSELVARWVYDHLFADGLPGLVKVRIEETCTAACEYWP